MILPRVTACALAMTLMSAAADASAGDDVRAVCPAWPGATMPQGPDAHLPPGEAPLRITADRLEGRQGESSRFTGRVLLQRGPRSLTTDILLYQREGNTVYAEGQVEYGDGDIEVSSDNALLELEPDRLRFDGVEYRLLQRRAHGRARTLEATRDAPVVLDDVRFTTCPPGDGSWSLRAPRIELDTAAGVGTGRNVRVEFKGVPIFYTPWISFPLTDERKSGFLAPDVGSSSRTGYDIRLPWYWNIAPDRDATITPRLIGDHGFQLLTEFRYLNATGHGDIELDTLPDDRERGGHRGRVAWQHRSALAPGWQVLADFNHVTDPDYYLDFGDELTATALTHQRRMAEISYHGDRHSFVGRLDGYQTLDTEIPRTRRPFARLPQLLLHTGTGGSSPLQATLDAELVRFTGDDRLSGDRVDVQPALELRLGDAGWHLLPRVAYRHTGYRLDGAAPGGDDDPARSLPSYSIDGGLAFERLLGDGRVQTLEPRLFYLYIPHRDQAGLPLFDTSEPDFNIIQLFRENRFYGADRVGDAHQLSIGAGSRIYDSSGTERLNVQLGRIRHFTDRRVTLPGETPDTRDWSDLVAEADARIAGRWAAKFGLQWDPDSGVVTRSAAAVRWRPERGRTVDLGWRFRRDLVDQADLGFSWSLGERWGIVGRWNYSFEASTNLETIFGVEYQSCCWAMQLVSREYIATRDGEVNRSLYLQLQLKGLASMGRGSGALLDRGILGD